MIVFGIYLLVFAFLIYYNGFFKLFIDEHLNNKTITLIFILKALAVPCLYFLFLKLYGGIEKFDAGKFYFDAKTLNEFGRNNFPEYLKALFGLQDETPGSHFYNTIIVPTFNWENGDARDFFYNDNRVIIRLHSVLHFIAFNSYYVHALFSCFLSYIGLTYLYKTFKQFFTGKETILFIVICFFPTLWLYTGGLLKEGVSVFILGCSLYQLKLIFEKGFNIYSALKLLPFIFISFLLKPYLILYAIIYFTIFYTILKFYKGRYKVLGFVGALCVVSVIVNSFVVVVKGKSLSQAAMHRQKEFADLSKGGIFLLDSVKFVRLNYDYNSLIKVPAQKNVYKIKANVPYTYWEHSHQKDTLFCESNTDSQTTYTLIYELPTAGSNVDVIGNTSSLAVISARSLYYTIAHPFFYNANGVMQLFASLENLILIVCFLTVIVMLVVKRNDGFVPFVFLFFGITLFILIGITTPNSGAILRYRSAAAIFVIISALYYFRNSKKSKAPF